MRVIRTIGIVVLSTTLLTGCAVKSLFVSGISLEALGNQFVSTTEYVTAACDARTLPHRTCAAYRDFALHFVDVFPATIGMWEAARKAGDTETQKKAEDTARQLASELAKLAAEVLRGFAPPKEVR